MATHKNRGSTPVRPSDTAAEPSITDTTEPNPATQPLCGAEGGQYTCDLPSGHAGRHKAKTRRRTHIWDQWHGKTVAELTGHESPYVQESQARTSRKSRTLLGGSQMTASSMVGR